MAGNVAGIDARLSPDLADDDIAQFLAQAQRLDRVAIRHTVGLDDRIEGACGVADANENAGARYFKLKLNGDPDADAARLTRIGNELATLPHDYRVTLDANEQYADLAALTALVDRLDRDSALSPIATKLLYIEQPMPRDITRASPLGALVDARFHHRRSRRFAMTRSRRRGRSAIAASPRNPARASTSRSSMRPAPPNGARRARNSLSPAEDLTCQAGLAVQQDLALGALIGVTHAERNGHHYVDGFGDTPADEAEAFLARIPISTPAMATPSGCRSTAAIS